MTPLATNKGAERSFTILDRFDAGIVLKGYETKSVKTNNMNLKGSYVSIRDGEVFLLKAHIGKYKPAGTLPHYDPVRSRKLLLTKKEIRYLIGKVKEKGLTIIPLQVYSKRGILKITIATARGKSTVDKRRVLREREMSRTLRRIAKGNNA